jgi:hypothetical protein
MPDVRPPTTDPARADSAVTYATSIYSFPESKPNGDEAPHIALRSRRPADQGVRPARDGVLCPRIGQGFGDQRPNADAGLVVLSAELLDRFLDDAQRPPAIPSPASPSVHCSSLSFGNLGHQRPRHLRQTYDGPLLCPLAYFPIDPSVADPADVRHLVSVLDKVGYDQLG